MSGNANKGIYDKAKLLRYPLTSAENVLWERLKNRKFHGYKFRRQHPYDSFILDFYCYSHKLCIELDGSYHDDEFQKVYDVNRENWLKENGIRIIRFKNEEITNNLEDVLKIIFQELSHIDGNADS